MWLGFGVSGEKQGIVRFEFSFDTIFSWVLGLYKLGKIVRGRVLFMVEVLVFSEQV